MKEKQKYEKEQTYWFMEWNHVAESSTKLEKCLPFARLNADLKTKVYVRCDTKLKRRGGRNSKFSFLEC